MDQQNFILEVTNGVVSLLILCLLVWLLEHLRVEFSQRQLTWRLALFGLPSVAIVVALSVENFGNGLTRAMIWVWRIGGGDRPFNDVQNLMLITGSVLTAIGLLWMIAILSRPRYGEWPWRASAAIAGGYALIATVFRLYA